MQSTIKKMDETKNEIEIRLLKVQEIGFYMDSSLFGEIKASQLNDLHIFFGFKLKPDIKRDLLVLDVLVKYNLGGIKGKKILEIESSNAFKIKNIKDLLKIKDDTIEDTSGITPTLVGIAIGTIRGMLVTKTAGTPLDKYPIPIINPATLCDKTIPNHKESTTDNTKQS